jgi:sugar (pentulose or hexulose) kinase
MEKYILAMDQGTTSSRCIIYDNCFYNKPFELISIISKITSLVNDGM